MTVQTSQKCANHVFKSRRTSNSCRASTNADFSWLYPDRRRTSEPIRSPMITRILLSGLLLTSLVSADPPSEFFNGKDLTGWSGNDGFWSVKDGAIVGHSDHPVAKNEFIWSEVEVRDFHLVVDVRLTPNNRNAGIQFRSKKTNEHGQAHGYQADVGAGVWGKLYHEHGRGKLDWNNHAAEAVKPGEWNRYEILAVGDRIWTAINGTRCVSVRDPQGERAGFISFQIHSGPAQTVEYRNPLLTHNPPVKLANLNEAELNAKLTVIGEPAAPAVPAAPVKRRIKAREASAAAQVDFNWPARIAAADPGSQKETWAKPDFDDKAWKTMTLPGHFENAGLPGFDGVVWFRKTIALTAEQAKTPEPTLGLGQIDDMDVTWVNGKRVGGYEVPGHHYTVRNYPIPADVLQAGENTIAVRVMDHGLPGGIAGNPELLVLRVGDHKISLANEWKMAAGANLAQLKAAKVAEPGNPAPDAETRFQNGFALERGDVVAFIGGSGMVKQVESGALETFLTHAAGGNAVYFRDLAWQADTVYQRQRPRNFGTQAEALDRIGATIVVAAFGQMEAMDGADRLTEFIDAYEAVLQEVRPRTGQIVLITPFPFERPASNPHLPDLTKHNDAVAAYAKAIVKLADRNGWIAVDLSRFETAGLTMDGFQLTPDGHAKWARTVTQQLLGEPAGVLPENWEMVHNKIQKKNVLWRRHWRPTNWAFLYGNRQGQPSSGDHRPGKPRWFPEEINAIIPLIETAENDILELRKAAQ